MEQQTTVNRTPNLWAALGWSAFVGGVLFVLVVALRGVALDAVRSGGSPWSLEVWAGTLALGYLGVASWAAVRHRGPRGALLGLGCVVFVGLVWLGFVRQMGAAKWDFECYFYAGKAIGQGVNIYDVAALEGRRYLYSPLLATLFSAVNWLPFHVQRQEALAYFLWSIGNYWAVMVFFLLLAASVKLYGIKHPLLWVGLGAAILCNVPLQRTLVYSQLNLHVANLVLGFLLCYRRRPGLAGGMLAAAVLLKTSPLLLLAPVVVERRWRALGGFAAGLALLAGITIAAAGAGPWGDFARSLGGIVSHGHYRDNSIQSLLMNTGRIFGWPAVSPVVMAAAMVLSVAFAGGLIYLSFRKGWKDFFMPARPGVYLEGAFPLLLAAMLIASPLLWEHHWVFVQLPFVLLVARALGTRFIVPALLCYGLVYFVPTFDVFPLSYHRLAAFAGWVYLVGAMAREDFAKRAAAPLGP